MKTANATLKCPACESSLSVSTSLDGQRAKCPKCGERFVIDVSASSLNAIAASARANSLDPAAQATALNTAESINAVRSDTTTTSSTANSKSRVNEASIGKIGRFYLREVLGQGAFGRVYRAYDAQLDRMLALKVPIFHEDELKKAARFEQEAKAAASLRHPNIIPVFDSGRVDNHYYIASQFIEGVTLSSQMKRGQVPFAQAATWAKQIASALAYAHEMGIVHRDVKPQNIMLDSRNEPQLMDFGLAKRVNEDSSMTTEGSLLGTPAYMSPEQARGEVSSIGPKSDQYAVGTMLFEMLTGQRPFDGPPHAVLAQIISQEPPSPQSLRPDVPKDLTAITLKAMSKSPAHRYASCNELVMDLDRWLRGEPIMARTPTLIESSLRIAQRNKTLTILSLSLLTVVTFSLLAVSWALLQAQSANVLAEKNFEEAKKQKELADQQAEFANAQADLANAQAKLAKEHAELAEQQTKEAEQQRDLANSEKLRAEQAEGDLRKKQEALQQSVYASRLTQIADGWKQRSDAFRLSQKLDAIAVDSDLSKLRGFEWYYWRNHFDRRFLELPLDGNTIDWEYGFAFNDVGSLRGCCISEDGELIVVCDPTKALIWKTASRRLLKAIDLSKIHLADHVLTSCFAIRQNGRDKLLLSYLSDSSSETSSRLETLRSSAAILVDVETEVVESSIPEASYVKVAGVGIALRRTDSDRATYKTFPDGKPLGSSIPAASELLCIDSNNRRRLVSSPEAIKWLSPNDTVVAQIKVDQLEDGRRVISASVSFPLKQILVKTGHGNHGVSTQNYVLDWNLKLISAQKLTRLSGLLDTIFADQSSNATIVTNRDFYRVTNDPHWYEHDYKSLNDSSNYFLPIGLRQLKTNADGTLAIGLVGSKGRHSSECVPIIIQLHAPIDSYTYPKEDEFFRSRIEDEPLRFAICEQLDDRLNVRLFRVNEDGSKTETVRSIKHAFRKPKDKNTRTYQIRFGKNEVCGLTRDGRAIEFYSLDGKAYFPKRTITLDGVADCFVLDPTENHLAVVYEVRASNKKLYERPLLQGAVGLFDLQHPAQVNIDYEFYFQCYPTFDNTGRWLFLHAGSFLIGGDIRANGKGDVLSQFNRTKIYDTATGERLVDIPLPEGEIATTVVGDASVGVFARGTVIYRSDGEKICEIEDGSAVRGISPDGKRLITATSIVDSRSGEVLLNVLGSASSRSFWIQGNSGYCVREDKSIQWFPFLRKEQPTNGK